MSEGFDYNNVPKIPSNGDMTAPSDLNTLDKLPEEQVVSQSAELNLNKPPEPPKSWQENKKIAAAILIVGLIIIFVIFYSLFKSAGII